MAAPAFAQMTNVDVKKHVSDLNALERCLRRECAAGRTRPCYGEEGFVNVQARIRGTISQVETDEQLTLP